MTNDPTSLGSRARAALAGTLARFAAGARRLEAWTARGTRPLLFTVVIGALVLVSLVGVLGAAVGGRHLSRWWHGGPEIGRAHRGPEPRFIGKPHGDPAAKPDGRRGERSQSRPGGPPAPGPADTPPPPPPPPPPGR